MRLLLNHPVFHTGSVLSLLYDWWTVCEAIF